MTDVAMNQVPGTGKTPMKCSYCGEAIDFPDQQWMPFCSRRCKEIDLANWLTESYGLPYEGEDAEFIEDRINED
jgi:endogenous inhibitor of DNA gyrase (YacG/DUF329 family)